MREKGRRGGGHKDEEDDEDKDDEEDEDEDEEEDEEEGFCSSIRGLGGGPTAPSPQPPALFRAAVISHVQAAP